MPTLSSLVAAALVVEQQVGAGRTMLPSFEVVDDFTACFLGLLELTS
jgi:hypothetical protein